MLTRDARWVAAAVQGIIAWEWLVSGINKVLAGTFPQDLADTLRDGMRDNPNGWYVSLLQGVVLPHSVIFGYAIEATEIFIGIALLIGAVVLIGPLRHRDSPQYHLALGEVAAATAAALLCVFLCVNFHFFMGDGLIPWFSPAHAFDEGISLDTLMPPLAVVVLVVNVYALAEMANFALADHLRGALRRLRLLFGARLQASSSATERA